MTLDQVATVTPGWTPDEDHTRFGAGAAAGPAGPTEDAVSIAIAKKPGTNAVDVAQQIHAHSPAPICRRESVTFTRDDGEKANLAVNELIERLAEAIGIVVVLLLASAGGRRWSSRRPFRSRSS